MAHLSRIKDIAGGTTCPAPMTRLALIALRNASGLNKDCDYVVTDHVQGRLVAGTTIHLQAVNTNTLSENVQVKTTYDNEAWFGIYDLDRGLVLELHDNRNNIARGLNGTEVSNFDWGNTNITNTTVNNATWSSTIGSVRTVNDLQVLESATFTSMGQTGGTINRTTIKGSSTVNLTNANVSLSNWNVGRQSFVDMTAFTAGSLLNNYTLDNSIINFANSTSGVSLAIVTLIGSTINHSGVTTGTLTGVNLIMDDSSTVTHSNGAGNLSLNRVKMSNNAQINQSQGTISLSDYKITGLAFIQQTAGTGGNISLSAGEISGSSQVFNQSASNINGTRYYSKQNSAINVNNGTTGIVTLTGSTFNESSQLNINAPAISGNTSLLTTQLNNTSLITRSGIGALTLTDSSFNSNSRLTLSNARGLSVTRSDFKNLVQITQSGTGVVTDNLVDSIGENRVIFQFSATGASANSANYVHAYGLGSNYIITGTSSSQTFNRTTLNASTLNCTNNTAANTYNNLTAFDGSSITLQNHTVTRTATNLEAFNGSTITIDNPTGAGSLNTIHSKESSSVVITGPVTNVTIAGADEGGGLVINGGSSTRVFKRMFGTLTTGNFTHNGVIVINSINATLTANNSNRSSYLGVVSSVPLI